MKGKFVCFALLGVISLYSGCATPPPSTELDFLISALNASSSSNREARAKLKALGANAVPRLLQDVDHSASYLRSHDNSLSAMRALRALREIDTSAALPACRRLLTEEYFPPTTKQDAALLNEALAVVYDHFSHREARDIFFIFITGNSSRYVRRIRQGQHWDAAIYRPRVEVDVVRGLRLMVSAKDNRAAKALTAFLKSIDVDSMSRTYYHRLAENGYTVTEATTTHAKEQVKKLEGK